jgi:hypothetical protein
MTPVGISHKNNFRMRLENNAGAREYNKYVQCLNKWHERISYTPITGGKRSYSFKAKFDYITDLARQAVASSGNKLYPMYRKTIFSHILSSISGYAQDRFYSELQTTRKHADSAFIEVTTAYARYLLVASIGVINGLKLSNGRIEEMNGLMNDHKILSKYSCISSKVDKKLQSEFRDIIRALLAHNKRSLANKMRDLSQGIKI